MKTKIKPNFKKVLFQTIFIFLIVLVICFGLFSIIKISNDFYNSLNIKNIQNSLNNEEIQNPLNNKNITSLDYLTSYFNNLKYLIYGIIIIILTIFIFYFINIIGNTLTTEYIITDNYLSRTTTFFNEIKEDVPINEITNIDYTISWFWDKIFKTGSISIYTSGSQGVDLNFNAINSPIKIYNIIKLKIDSFRKSIINGEENKLIKSIKPNVKIVILSHILPSSIIYFLFLFNFIHNFNFWIVVGIVILLIINNILLILRFKKKRYDFYSNKLEYYDGFLTFHKVTVPYERIISFNLTKSLIDRIFGTSTINIETAGTGGSEINILYINNGDEILTELKEVLKKNGKN